MEYKCNRDQCDKKYKSKQCLSRHLRLEHSSAPKQKIYICGRVGCSKKYYSKPELNRHTKIEHLKIRYPCNFCSAKFRVSKIF